MYNFQGIFTDCRQRFQGFNREFEKTRKPRSFEAAIRSKKKRGLNPVIAEVKPSSPRGKLREIRDARGIVKEMRRGGACGISVLTEEKFFGGSLKNLKAAAEASGLPVLRKDFIFHPEQVREAYYYGADSVLLIAGLLSREDLGQLVYEARGLGMEPMVEVHSESDVDKAEEVEARLVLINNRDMETLEVDLKRGRALAQVVGSHMVKIGASGIKSPSDLRYVLESCDAALVGTAIMLADSVEEKVRELVYG
jgi:indole-3-glycerol phosphate synthase